MKNERGCTTSKVSKLRVLIRLLRRVFLLQSYGIDDLVIRPTKCFLHYLCFLLKKLILLSHILVTFVFVLNKHNQFFLIVLIKLYSFFSLIHCDVWGPYRTHSSCGAAYFLTIVDDFSIAVWTYLMLKKSKIKGLIQNFCIMSEKQFGKQVKTIRSDNGSEFVVLKSFF